MAGKQNAGVALVEAVAAEVAQSLSGHAVGELLTEIRELRTSLAIRERQVFTPMEAAEYLGISRSTLDALAGRGALRSAKIGGSVRYRKQWLDDALEAGAGKATHAATIVGAA